MGEGNIFSLFTLAGGGVPHLRSGGGLPHLRSEVGRYPISGPGGYLGQVLMLGRGVPNFRSEVGGYPSQVSMMGGYPGTPYPGMGYPPDMGWGTPRSWDGVPTGLGMGYPPGPGMGYPPRHGMGYPPDLRWGNPPRQISIVSTCYAAGGMPLAFTQEDFLVTKISLK